MLQILLFPLFLYVKKMATYTITISDRSNKTKHLLGLIKEMAKTENEFIIVEHAPNAETLKALEDSKTGKVVKSKSKEEFFAKLKS
jgi:hypothetical protein